MVENLPTQVWLMCSEAEGVGSLSFLRMFTKLVKMLMYLVGSFMLNHPSNLRAAAEMTLRDLGYVWYLA